jgi:hypothetical protein
MTFSATSAPALAASAANSSMDSSALIVSKSEGVRFELELRPVRRRPTSTAIS